MKTFRFHYDGWVDIQAESEVEAVEKYNNGEYENEDEGFENTYVEEL